MWWSHVLRESYSWYFSWYVPSNASSFGDSYSIFIVFAGTFPCDLQHFINDQSPYSFMNMMLWNLYINTGTCTCHSWYSRWDKEIDAWVWINAGSTIIRNKCLGFYKDKYGNHAAVYIFLYVSLPAHQRQPNGQLPLQLQVASFILEQQLATIYNYSKSVKWLVIKLQLQLQQVV